MTHEDSWLHVKDGEEVDYSFTSDEIDTSFLGLSHKYEIPNMLYSPENIFANNIAALDVNFLRPNTYESVYVEGGSNDFEQKAQEASVSGATQLKEVIANWYKSFRNIAIVALLSILIYLGIRILIGSTAEDKAKYKEAIKDWVVALCLVFFMQFILSATLMVCDQITNLFSESIEKGYVVQVGDDTPFRTNIMGLVRFRAQAKSAGQSATYTILYGILVVQTVTFTFMYYKRLLYMAFFTVISPLVAVTYPIDKYGDGKAQALNMVLREFVENAAMQPIHMIIYGFLTAPAIAGSNPLYAIAAIWFVIPGYKWFVKLFDGGNSETAKGDQPSVAGAAMAMSAMQKLGSLGAGGKGKKKGADGKSDDEDNDDIFMPRDEDGELLTFGGEPDDGMAEDGDETGGGLDDGALDAGGLNAGNPNAGGPNNNPNSPEEAYNFNDEEEAAIQQQLQREMDKATWAEMRKGRRTSRIPRKERKRIKTANGFW